jgi:nicotinate (nicotinamide) nucleotide adenylyltransferase
MNNPVCSGAHYALIYGLSANPVHQGHIDLVTGALDNLLNLGYDVAQTVIIPVYRRNPVGNIKDDLPETFEQRMKMCEIAAQEVLSTYPDIPISVSRVEAHLAKKSIAPNYTAETLTYLKSTVLTGLDLIFLIGSGIVSGKNPEFSQWHKTDTILKVTRLAVCPRPGFPINLPYINALTLNGGHFILLDNVKTPGISSTVLRERLQRGENPIALAEEGLIPLSIAQYLNEQELYQNNITSSKKAQFHHENSI